jgi:Holliday junction resolvase RusA-like endonuclease
MKIEKMIVGIPYSQNKVKGDIGGCARWSQVIIDSTKSLPKLKPPYRIDITFILPGSKYPKDHPYGSDLDNLTKRLFDALNNTIFSEAPGKDGSVIKMIVSKRKAVKDKPTGALIIVTESH